MITLEQIKNDYAVSKGSIDWKDFTFWFDDVDMEKHMDNICELAQKECLKLASENVKTVHHELQTRENVIKAIHLTKDSITNENNIIK